MSEPNCFINNQFLPLAEAGIPVNDLGIQRGYGIFDFLRVSHNIPLFLDDHLNRFYHSAGEMRLPVAQSKEAIKEIIKQLLVINNQPDSGIRILLTGGPSKDGYEIVQPNLAIIQQPITLPADWINQQGYKLVTYPHVRQMPKVKTTDYLMAIWLQPWVKEKGADDVLYHQNGIVSECPRSNFFIITKEKILVTPSRNILFGVTRKQLLKLAAANGIAVEERDISLEEIRLAKEAFISSSTKRLTPVVAIDDIVFEPFTKESLTAQLYELFLQNEKEYLRSGFAGVQQI